MPDKQSTIQNYNFNSRLEQPTSAGLLVQSTGTDKGFGTVLLTSLKGSISGPGLKSPAWQCLPQIYPRHPSWDKEQTTQEHCCFSISFSLASLLLLCFSTYFTCGASPASWSMCTCEGWHHTRTGEPGSLMGGSEVTYGRYDPELFRDSCFSSVKWGWCKIYLERGHEDYKIHISTWSCASFQTTSKISC